MTRKKALFTAAVAALPLLVGAAALRQVSVTSDQLRSLLTNPFHLTSRVGASGPVVLERVQALRRLETSRYHGQVVVNGDTGGILPRWVAGDRMLFVGQGEVVAGIDLAGLKPEDVRVENDAVTLRLPRAQVLYTRLDNRRSEVWERRTGFLSGPDRTLESRVRLEAEERIRQAALDQGVLQSADAEARRTVRAALQPLGFRQVTLL